MYEQLQIVPIQLLQTFQSQFDKDVKQRFEQLHDSELSIDTFNFYTSVSAVFSSKIEGEEIELDSFIKHKRFGVRYQPDYTQKIDDLYNAYLFAQQNTLSAETLPKVHVLLTKNILQKKQQGQVRTGNMFVLTKDGRIEYVAAAPEKVKQEMKKLYHDIELLIQVEMSLDEAFFFASLLHLVFVKIHPFDDGNGRTARLLEKWFLAQKLGSKAWFTQSEKDYCENHLLYYNNLCKLGLEYDELEYGEALPFLEMLPKVS